ncbi:MAG: 2'-5' RNA ligase family protein [Oligoflexia bacterium]|nr:2'-5' RNA ligase family protein [Oligoflexia bacterium]
MFKRRQLGQHPSRQKHKNNNQEQGQSGPNQNQRSNEQNKQNSQQRRQQSQQSGPNQNQRRGNKNRRHRGGHHQRPQTPPPFIQRDVLLIANKEQASTIEQVRARFDPLSKKIPAHITVLFSETADKIQRELLKKLNFNELPSVKTITFKSVEIVNDKYLWLIPDEESSTKLKTWHDEFRKFLPEGHTQEENYVPHLTLGYIPRKTPEDEALSYARGIINMPLVVNFDSVLLEEFSEDQNSRQVDRLQITL